MPQSYGAIVVSVGALDGGGWGRDDGDGGGVWLFGMIGPQTCTPSKIPVPSKPVPFEQWQGGDAELMAMR
jgi:hypothetical protein